MLKMTHLDGTPRKVILTIIVALVGLFVSIFSPVLAILLLIGMVGLLPVNRTARISLVMIGCLSICLGAGLATGDLPISHIATLKMQGSPIQAAISGMI